MAGKRVIGCIWAPRIRARLELRRQPELAGHAGLIVDRSGHQAMVLDCLPAAAEVRPGMTLAQARSLAPDAVVLEADAPYYRHEFERVLEALEAVSDRVEEAELGLAYVGLDGLERMHGGEAQLFEALFRAVPERYQPHVGVGANKFTAFVAARSRRSAGLTKTLREAASFLASQPIELLPCSPRLLDDLRLLGLDTLGAVAGQDANALLDRFGHEGRRVWELSSGIDDRPLVPRTHEEQVTETLTLPAASVSLELLRTGIETLLARAFAQPRMQGRYAGAAALSCALEDAPMGVSSWERTYHFKTAVGSWRRAAEVITARLETEHPPAAVEAITLTLTRLSGASGEQLSLFPDQRVDRERRLLETERDLQARLNGQRALHRLVDAAPWHPAPELRTLQVSIDPLAQDGMRPLSVPTAVEVREGEEREPRAVRVSDRWRTVVEIEEQWSFDLWWRPTPLTRAYYRVSQDDGRRLTIYRDQREARWYRQSA